MSPEQVVVAVVYGQQVPEEPAEPPAETPQLEPATAADATLPAPAADATAPAADATASAADATASAADGSVPASAAEATASAADGSVPASGGGVALDDALVAPAEDSGGFTVRLSNFTGPFDLLLQLIGKHKLDVTEVALHQVTDDFIVYIRAMGDDWDLGEASEFLLVAATLLDLKAARLLPAAEVEDEEDLALLEARDLLFARLLQYKAFKEAAAYLSDLEGTGAKRYPRDVSMEPRYAEALPDLVLGIGIERLFKLALKQFSPKPGPPQVSIAHIHQMRVSVREHAALLRDRLRRAGSATFALLVADCENTLEVVARFLALLELYREGLIEFEQPVSLDELTVRWIGGDAPDSDLDIDDYEGTRPDPDAPPSPEPSDGDLDAEVLEDADLDGGVSSPSGLDDSGGGLGVSGGGLDIEDLETGRLDSDISSSFRPGADSAVPSTDAVSVTAGPEADVSSDPSGEAGRPLNPTLSSTRDGLSEGAVAGAVGAARDGLSEGAVAGDLGAARDGLTAGESGGEAGDSAGDSGDGPVGTFGAAGSGSGETGTGTIDAPRDRRDVGGDDDDAASAAVEERQ